MVKLKPGGILCLEWWSEFGDCPESFIVPELSYSGPHCLQFICQLELGNFFFFFWYEVISCAKEFDLFISIQGNSWNVLCLLRCCISGSDVFSSFKPCFPQGLSGQVTRVGMTNLRSRRAHLLLTAPLLCLFTRGEWVSQQELFCFAQFQTHEPSPRPIFYYCFTQSRFSQEPATSV